RSRDSHREFESALERRGVPTYVYKGLGFFDADEVQDAVAILRYLADPLSNLRAAALLRSRIVRVSDAAVAALGSACADALLSSATHPAALALAAEDRRVLEVVRAALPRWLSWVDRLAPSELLDGVLHETAYAYELRGSRRRQARENLKKLRAMIRRGAKRGYGAPAGRAGPPAGLAAGGAGPRAGDGLPPAGLWG